MQYKLLRNILPLANCDEAADWLECLIDYGDYFTEDLFPDSHSFYNKLSYLSPLIQPKLEETFGVDLNFTYDCARIYNEGDVLSTHKDRFECQYSVTINLRNTDGVWPIYLHDPETNEIKSFELYPGDGLALMGRDLFHWRDTCKVSKVHQAFWHYVDNNEYEHVPPGYKVHNFTQQVPFEMPPPL